MQLSELVTDIQRDFPDPMDSAVLRCIRRSLRDFCIESEAWRHTFTDFLVEGETAYPFELPAETYVVAVDYCKVIPESGSEYPLTAIEERKLAMYPDGQPRTFAMVGDELLLSNGGGVGELQYAVKLAPTRNITEVPEDFADKYIDTVRNGALFHLLRTPAHWSSGITQASIDRYGGMFHEGILQAKRMARKDRNRPRRVAVPNGDYQVGNRGTYRSRY